MTRRLAIDIAMDARARGGTGLLLSVGPLPEGVKDLLRIVADGEWRDHATDHVYARHSAADVRAASAALLAATLFDRAADPYRTLGLTPDAKPEDVRENKRLLLKWLHPDRNPDPLERGYLGRVIEAAEAIEEGRATAARADVRPPPIVVRPSRAKITKKPRPSVARLAARQLAAGTLRLGKLLRVAAAVAVIGLVSGRYVMDEPIGASIERYGRLAQGMITW